MARHKEPKTENPLKKTSTATALSMMQGLPDCVVAFDKDCRIVFSNHSAQSFFLLSEKSMMGRKLENLVGDESPIIEAVQKVIRTHHHVTLHEMTVNDRKVDSVTLTSLDRENLFMMVIRHSLLSLKEEWSDHAIGALQPAQNLARVWAHEIKNPLAGIRGAAQLLKRAQLRDEDKELANLIEQEADRIFRLIDKLKIFGENMAQVRRRVNLHEVLDHVTKVAKSSFADHVDIEEKYDPSMPEIEGDFDNLVQAQMNLVKNAAEALPKEKRGRISIRTFYDKAAAFHPHSHDKLPLCIEIEDNGEGITPELISRIFQPYFTTKPQGEGLGLPIVSKIIDDHGGVIDVKSKPGSTVFRLRFPMPAGTVVRGGPAPAAPTTTTKRRGR